MLLCFNFVVVLLFMMLEQCLSTDVKHQYSTVRRGPHRHAVPFKMQTRGNNLPLKLNFLINFIKNLCSF